MKIKNVKLSFNMRSKSFCVPKKKKTKQKTRISNLENIITRKNHEAYDQYSSTRFMLFYADDIIQKIK